MIKIPDKSKCCGCCACAGICPTKCIEMKADQEGFVYPAVNQDICVDCHLCEKVCPVLNVAPDVPDLQFPQEGYIVQHKDSAILREATAGGAFTAIAKYVLDRNGAVFGVELQDDLYAQPSPARHIAVEQYSDLKRFRNSKYVHSYVSGETYQQVMRLLTEGKYVCFSGTPCQVEGVKRYLEIQGQSIDFDKLILVDVVCRAVPSPLIFRKYIELQEKKLAEKITCVHFRDKHYGYKYSTMNVITDKNQGNYHKGVESDPWLRAFFSNICDRPSCHDCQFRKIYRVSDFTIWDCFNVGRFSKELDNDKGATRVLVHTEKGRKAFEKINSDLIYVKVAPANIISGVKEMRESVVPDERRSDFFQDAARLDGTALFKKYFPETIRVKLERTIRLFCYRLGIYSVAKKLYVRITKKY